jgi:hypothetical protein
MPKSNRRAQRRIRGSTRNESCGIGGNEPPEKPRLKTRAETTPVRKPKFIKTVPAPEQQRTPVPVKIKEPKAPGMTLSVQTMKELEDFNRLVEAVMSGEDDGS